ncbi:MAG: PTS sugar transporter subunit IIA [Planctomycetes bacterium]|nr:PTS sugar transporter subunit IIA [Planctomycetota bacterium]MCC7170834.1 PTS sugar transporter subunit IIA [Planctomycetota bacterium]
MRLSDLLRPEAVLLGVKGLDKWALIERLCDQLVHAQRLPASRRQQVLDALFQRERSMSTGMENGIAIPHCSLDEIEDTLVVLGISREGVQFESIDGKPSHLILLLVTPRNKTKVHIRTLAEIAKLLNDSAFREKLVAAESSADAVSLIRAQETE